MYKLKGCKLKVKYFYTMLFLFFSYSNLFMYANEDCCPLSKTTKILHLTFHKGCAKEIESVAKELSLDLTTWFIHDLAPYEFDGMTKGSAIYNIGHDRAKRVWDLHFDFFDICYFYEGF